MSLVVPVLTHTSHFLRGRPNFHLKTKLVEKCGVTYSMLSTPEAASDVFFDPQDGVLAGLSAGKSLVDCATLQVEARARLFEFTCHVCVPML